MIPNAFYEVKYSYDRGAKRWMGTFISRELENVTLTIPLVDGDVSFNGDDIHCASEEALGLAFLQFTESVAISRQREEIARQEAADKSKAVDQSQGPLDVPETE